MPRRRRPALLSMATLQPATMLWLVNSQPGAAPASYTSCQGFGQGSILPRRRCSLGRLLAIPGGLGSSPVIPPSSEGPVAAWRVRSTALSGVGGGCPAISEVLDYMGIDGWPLDARNSPAMPCSASPASAASVCTGGRALQAVRSPPLILDHLETWQAGRTSGCSSSSGWSCLRWPSPRSSVRKRAAKKRRRASVLPLSTPFRC